MERGAALADAIAQLASGIVHAVHATSPRSTRNRGGVLQMTRSNALLQRRCLLVIAAWASSLSREWRPTVYGVVVDVLRAPTSDAAVQLTAVATLRTLVEDFDFVDEQLVPFLQPLLSHLPALVHRCASADSHVRPNPLHRSPSLPYVYTARIYTTRIALTPCMSHNYIAASCTLLRLQSAVAPHAGHAVLCACCAPARWRPRSSPSPQSCTVAGCCSFTSGAVSFISWRLAVLGARSAASGLHRRCSSAVNRSL